MGGAFFEFSREEKEKLPYRRAPPSGHNAATLTTGHTAAPPTGHTAAPPSGPNAATGATGGFY